MASLEWLLNSSFLWIVSNSFQATILVGLILACKLVGQKRLSAKWHDAVWLLLILKLAIPWTVDSPVSMYNWLPTPGWEVGTAGQASYIEGAKTGTDFLGNQEAEARQGLRETFPGTQHPRETFSIWRLVPLVWLCGVVALFAATIWGNHRFSQALKREPLIGEQVALDVFAHCQKHMHVAKSIPLRTSRLVTSPSLTGIRRPQIVLPESLHAKLDAQELRHIFLHELAHYKRKDIAVNTLMRILLIVNWFNPVLWYAASMMRRDQEIACDALALSYMDEHESSRYGYTMIKLLELYIAPHNNVFTAGFSGSTRYLKRRMKMIQANRKKAYSWTVSGIIAGLLLGAVSLTSAQESAGMKTLFITPAEGKIVAAFDDTHHQNGISIAGNLNEPVVAAAAGTVLHAGYDAKAGNQIIIEHAGNYQTVYNHLEKLEVAAGAQVVSGQRIGLLGSTGRSTGPHLYFELRAGQTPVDPLPYIVNQKAEAGK